LAGTSGNRTQPGQFSLPHNGFEGRGRHQVGIHSREAESANFRDEEQMRSIVSASDRGPKRTVELFALPGDSILVDVRLNAS